MTLRPAVRRVAAPARAAGLAIGLLLLAGCGSSDAPGSTGSTPASGTTSPTPGPTTDGGTMTQTPDDAVGPGAVLTPQDDGATVLLASGDEVALQLAPPWDAAQPSSDDASIVEVVPVDHFADPGYAEFSLLAHGTGEVTVRAQGQGEEIVIHLTVTD